MSIAINPMLPFVRPHLGDHPFSRILQAHYGHLDTIAANTQLAFASGTTKISIPDPQFDGKSWAEGATKLAFSLKPAVRTCSDFAEDDFYSPQVLVIDGDSVHVLYAARTTIPQSPDWHLEYLYVFCEGQQVIISSVLEVGNGHDAQWSEMAVEYPNAQGGAMDPRWHGMPDRANRLEYLRWLAKRAPKEPNEDVDVDPEAWSGEH